MAMAFDALRVGKAYRIKNLGETSDFKVMEINAREYVVKDVNTLEIFQLSDFVKYGYGKDYDLYEIA